MEEHNMDLLQSLEIYIPVDAEVKSIHLRSVPGSVLRRMGLPLKDTEDSRKLSEPPEVIWISPVVLRRKGQEDTTPTGNSIVENAIGRRFKASQTPYRMSFFSSSKAAYKVLKETMPGNQVSVHTSPISQSSTASAPKTSQNAVVIYQGRLYLSIRRPNRSQRETGEPQPVSQASNTSSSVGTSKSQTELVNSDHKKKHATWKTTDHANRMDVTHEEQDVSSSTAECSAPQSADSVHRRRHSDARGEQDVEQVQDQEAVIINHNEIEEPGDEDAESSNQNQGTDRNMEIVHGEPGGIVDVVKQSHNQGWARRDPLGAASSALQQTVDFSELAQEEMIARMKAKLRQSEAALNSLHSS